MDKEFLRDQRGIEPTVMKLMAGIILLAIGLGVGIALYTAATKTATEALKFQVTLSPNAATISRENTKNISVSIERLGDYSKTVTLSHSGKPDNVTISFNPDNGVPSFGSTMTIIVGSAAVQKTTSITIKATGTDGVEKTATFELTVS